MLGNPYDASPLERSIRIPGTRETHLKGRRFAEKLSPRGPKVFTSQLENDAARPMPHDPYLERRSAWKSTQETLTHTLCASSRS